MANSAITLIPSAVASSSLNRRDFIKMVTLGVAGLSVPGILYLTEANPNAKKEAPAITEISDPMQVLELKQDENTPYTWHKVKNKPIYLITFNSVDLLRLGIIRGFLSDQKSMAGKIANDNDIQEFLKDFAWMFRYPMGGALEVIIDGQEGQRKRGCLRLGCHSKDK